MLKDSRLILLTGFGGSATRVLGYMAKNSGLDMGTTNDEFEFTGLNQTPWKKYKWEEPVPLNIPVEAFKSPRVLHALPSIHLAHSNIVVFFLVRHPQIVCSPSAGIPNVYSKFLKSLDLKRQIETSPENLGRLWNKGILRIRNYTGVEKHFLKIEDVLTSPQVWQDWFTDRLGRPRVDFNYPLSREKFSHRTPLRDRQFWKIVEPLASEFGYTEFV